VAGPQLASPAGRRPWAAGLGTGTGAGWLLALPVAFLAGCLIAPLVSVATTAVADKGWGVFGRVLASDLFVHAALRTLTLAAVVTVCCWVLGLAYALGLAVTRGAVRALLLGALLAVFWTSLVVRSYGWILIYQPSGPLSRLLVSLGLRDSPLSLLQTATAMYPAMVHVMLPLMVLPLYGALRTLDPARLQAARSLGAGPVLLVRAVVIPELRAASVAGATLVFISSLGFYVTPALLGGPSNLTTGTLIAQEFSGLLDYGTASAMGVLLLVAVAALYVAGDRLAGVSGRWGRT
jgi:ABC-type spermidine/putrescine transport system permease subunit I